MFRKKGKSKTFSADLQLLLSLKKYPARKVNATLLIFKFTWSLISVEIALDFCNIYILLDYIICAKYSSFLNF